MQPVDGKCYVYGTIPATEGYENSPSLGFIAHMDTVSEFTENPIHPVLHKNYDGQNLVFDEGGRVLDTVLFPHLKNLKGRTLITSDGTTILGADDKAGIAEIMTMAEYVCEVMCRMERSVLHLRRTKRSAEEQIILM